MISKKLIAYLILDVTFDNSRFRE